MGEAKRNVILYKPWRNGKHSSLYLASKYLFKHRFYNLWDLAANKGYALGYGYLQYRLFLNQITCKMYLWCLQKCSCFINK